MSKSSSINVTIFLRIRLRVGSCPLIALFAYVDLEPNFCLPSFRLLFLRNSRLDRFVAPLIRICVFFSFFVPRTASSLRRHVRPSHSSPLPLKFVRLIDFCVIFAGWFVRSSYLILGSNTIEMSRESDQSRQAENVHRKGLEPTHIPPLTLGTLPRAHE